MQKNLKQQAANIKPVVFLMGPTASGKTDLAVALVQRYPLEIISVDSTLVYRGMDIGTAKPTREILQKAPHHLIDIRDPAENYSVAQFREDALRLITEIHGRKRVPLLVGGTMLYFQALEKGISEMPASDAQSRQQWDQMLDQQGSQALHDRLKQVDPESAGRIHPNDPQRIVRALEVFDVSGVTMSEWWRRQKRDQLPWPVTKIALVPPRELIRERIARRFRKMIDEGLIEEVQQLMKQDLDPDLPAMRSVGYRQVLEYLQGEYDRDTMIEKGIVATRRLAKRQMTWLRSMENVASFDPGGFELTHLESYDMASINRDSGDTQTDLNHLLHILNGICVNLE